jgi:hypothetical protein
MIIESLGRLALMFQGRGNALSKYLADHKAKSEGVQRRAAAEVLRKYRCFGAISHSTKTPLSWPGPVRPKVHCRIMRDQPLICLFAFHFFNLRSKSPSLCCIGLSLTSLAMALVSSPYFSASLVIHSSSRLLCCRGLLLFARILASSSACASSSATTSLGFVLMALVASPSDKSSNGSFKGFNLFLRATPSSGPPSERTILRMRPV